MLKTTVGPSALLILLLLASSVEAQPDEPSSVQLSLCTFDNWCVDNVAPTGSALWDVYFASEYDGWAVGEGGTILHWNGLAWTEVPDGPTDVVLNSVWGTSPTDVWVVGEVGAILHFDGTIWSRVASGTPSSLVGVWASDPNV